MDIGSLEARSSPSSHRAAMAQLELSIPSTSIVHDQPKPYTAYEILYVRSPLPHLCLHRSHPISQPQLTAHQSPSSPPFLHRQKALLRLRCSPQNANQSCWLFPSCTVTFQILVQPHHQQRRSYGAAPCRSRKVSSSHPYFSRRSMARNARLAPISQPPFVLGAFFQLSRFHRQYWPPCYRWC